MARPETIDDVKDRTISVGTVDLGSFTTIPAVLKTWASFIESITKAGGQLVRKYSSEVEILMPRDEDQLKSQLGTEQYRWDQNQKVYDICAMNHTPPENWQKDSIKEWALAEGLPIVWEIERSRPDDEELRRLRAQLAGK